MTKPEMTLADSYREVLKERDELSASLARVRGLLQRQWVSVEERLPDGLNEFWCWIIPLPVDECPLNTSGDPITPNLDWSKPHADIVSTYKTKSGRIRFNCGGLEKVTHWMPRPDPPNFPQSSSLVPSGAESADIGKPSTFAQWYPEAMKMVERYAPGELGLGNALAELLTRVANGELVSSGAESGVEMGKVSRVEENMTAGELVSLSVRLLDIRERIEALPPDKTVFFRHFAPSVQDEMIALIGKLLSPHSSMVEPSPYKGQVTGSSPVAATILNTVDNGVKPCEYCARYNDRCCHCRNTNGMGMKDLLAGSAETGGEKADLERRIVDLSLKAWEYGAYIGDWEPIQAQIWRAEADEIEKELYAHIAGLASERGLKHKHFPTFPRSSQNQTVASGVEGAHEGITADGKVDSREPEKLNNAQEWISSVTAKVCHDFYMTAPNASEQQTDKLQQILEVALAESSLSEPPSARVINVAPEEP